MMLSCSKKKSLICVSFISLLTTSASYGLPRFDEINLGSVSIESTIRYPSVEVIENSADLSKVNQEIMAREFRRVEQAILIDNEADEP